MTPNLNKRLSKILSFKKSHLIFICIALVLSIAIMSAQRFFNTTLDNELQTTSASLLTADLEIASTTPLDTNILKTMEKKLPSFIVSKRTILSTMAQFNQQQESKLIELISITNNYPLRGSCIATNEFGKRVDISTLVHSKPNAIVISKELQSQYKLAINDTIKIGQFIGSIVGIIDSEPDINVQSLALGPRVYTSINNSLKTGFNHSLSRVYYSRFYAFDDTNIIKNLTTLIESHFTILSKDKTIQGSYGPSQPIVVRSYLDLSDNIVEGFEKLNEFYLFLSLFTLLLCAAAFAFIIWSRIISQLEQIGNLRYLGLSANYINKRYLKQSFNLAIIITCGGLFLGAIISQWVYNMVATISNFNTTIIDIAFVDVLFVSIFTITIMMSITLFILKVLNTPLQMEHFLTEQRSSSTSVVLTMILGSALLFILIFLKLNALSWTMIGLICLIFFLVLGSLLGLDYLIFPLFKYFYNTSLPIHVRLAMKCLSQAHTLRRLSFVSIALALITILSIAHYEYALEKEFNPESTSARIPTLFIVDLYEHQRETFNSLVTVPTQLAPMVQSRITHVNTYSIDDYAKTLKNDYFLYREQNLSTRHTQQSSETLIKGTWFDTHNNLAEASIEERFARRLNLSLGDTLTLQILNQPFTVTISSFRRVNWGSFEPNFFILIEPPYLNSFPQNWIGSIFADNDSSITSIQQSLAQQLPNVTIINIKQTSKKVFAFLKTFLLSIKIGSLMCFLIGAILFVLLAKLYRDFRKESFSMLYWIGLSKQKIQQITFIEQISFVITTFIVSFLISVMLMKLLCSIVIDIPFHINLHVTFYVGMLLISTSVLFLWFNRYEE